MDDPFVACPYNPIHQVKRSRLQYHIVKCEKNHQTLRICPYNYTHRLPEKEIKAHVAHCVTKQFISPEYRQNNVTARLTDPRPILQSDYLPENDPNHEMWDD